MDDDQDTPREDGRLNLHDESGMTRRDLMRRGAVVGGTLLWVAPAIQSIGSKAYAAVQGPSPGACAACYCFSGPKTNPTKDIGTTSGSGAGPFLGLFSNDDCENWCKHNPASTGGNAPNGPYESHEYCSGNANCRVNTRTDTGANGAFCD